jgi:hypothetical protein
MTVWDGIVNPSNGRHAAYFCLPNSISIRVIR